jgi:lipoprotein signal peptidase
VVLNFSNVLWLAIAVIELLLVAARFFMAPGPVRLSLAFLIPSLIILGAIANAIYNRITTGHALDDIPPVKRH